MFEIFFLISVSFYFIEIVIFIIGLNKKYPKLSFDKLPSVSVIVAARNEEQNILECLKSLAELDYPAEKLEIILVDDHSTDRTGEIIRNYINGKSQFKLIVPGTAIESLKGKTNALANALKIVNGEIILTTDADCTVSPHWVKTIASYYQNDVGFVGGFTTQKSETIFAGMQAVDFIYLLAVAAGTINLKKPLSCIGNNMSYRKSVYDQVGGYENLPFSVTEDFNLLMAIHKLKKYKIIYPLDDGGLVTSKPCEDWKSLFWQKKRWGVGGAESDLIGYLVMAWGFFSHIAMLLTPLFFSLTALYLCLFKIVVDYFFVYPVFNRLKLKLKLSHFVAFEIYFIVYVVLLPFIVLLNRKVKWKGREF